MASTSDIRNGLCLTYNGDIYSVVEFLHVKPGKGNAFVRTKLKSLTTGKVVENTFPEGSEIEILFHAEKNIPLTAEMPQSIILEITYTEPGVRGDTATNVTKPATVETGAEVKVPIFINQGDRIKIDTKTGAYLERVKA